MGYEKNPLELITLLESQFVLQGSGKYSIRNAFRHSNPNELLTFVATAQDGSALPTFINFDPATKLFIFDADAALKLHVKKFVVKVTVKDVHNHEVTASFDVIFETEKEKSKQGGDNVRGFVDTNLNYFDNESRVFAELLASLNGYQTGSERFVALDTDDHQTPASKAKNSLREQIELAGLLNYQQNKTQLLSDLTNLFALSGG